MAIRSSSSVREPIGGNDHGLGGRSSVPDTSVSSLGDRDGLDPHHVSWHAGAWCAESIETRDNILTIDDLPEE